MNEGRRRENASRGFKEGFEFVYDTLDETTLMIDHGVYDQSCLVIDHKPYDQSQLLHFLNLQPMCARSGGHS